MVLGIIRLKGKANIKKEVRDTFRLLRLYRKHHCTLLPATPDNVGMLKKIERYVTWGELKPEIIEKLIKKRGRLPGNKRVTEKYIKEKTGNSIKKISEEIKDEETKLKNIPGLKSYFRLKPPTKGLKSGGIKRSYSLGGALGYRGKEINSLLKRMI